MDMGNIMGGQNPYAGQDTGFGDSLRALLTKQFGGGQPAPAGNMGAVDPAQAAYTGAVAPDFNAPPVNNLQGLGGMQTMSPSWSGQGMSPLQTSMMQSNLLRGV